MKRFRDLSLTVKLNIALITLLAAIFARRSKAWMRSSSSFSPSTVRPGPVWNWHTGMRRIPAAPITSNSASSA